MAGFSSELRNERMIDLMAYVDMIICIVYHSCNYIYDFVLSARAYSHHPALNDYMDSRVFVDIPPTEQLARIKKRNGAETVRIYADKWIPMEEAYLQAYEIKDNAHVVV